MELSEENFVLRQLHKGHNRQHSTIHFVEPKAKSKWSKLSKRILTRKNIKTSILVLTWLVTTVIFIVNPERTLKFIHLDVPPKTEKIFRLSDAKNPRLDVHLNGAFSGISSNPIHFLQLYVANKKGDKLDRISENVSFPLGDDFHFKLIFRLQQTRLLLVDQKQFETTDPETVSKILPLSAFTENDNLYIVLSTNCDTTFTLSLAFESKPFGVATGICMGALILIGLYILIIFEIVDRAFAAIVAANVSLAALAIFNERPNIEEILTWIDMDTLMLLFGMMILVAISSETGIFDYMAVLVYKKTKGNIWRLICSLSIITMASSMILDSVSTILLMTPVVIRICEVSNFDPVKILTIIILAVNIGSAASPIGNPPNIMIINNERIKAADLTFGDFIIHMSPGIILVILQSYIQLRYVTYRNIKVFQNEEPVRIANIIHEIAVCQKDARSISCMSKFDDIHRRIIGSRISGLKEALQREMEHEPEDEETNDAVDDFETMFAIKNKTLLIHCSITFSIVVLLFFLHSAPYFKNLSMGWISVLGVILLLIISNNDDFKACLLMVEWSSLMFFAALFVLMESLTKIGLIEFIGEQLAEVVKLVSIEHRITVAIVLVLWVSTIISAFLDNIPLVSMMIKVVLTLSTSLNIKIHPLVWALAFGCGVGGNGTLIASSANLICVGVAEQHGYKFTFLEFFKVGFPLMLLNASILTVYLILCHVVFDWN